LSCNLLSPCASLFTFRWEEIDWDKDGKITFKEFLLAVSGWVGLGEAGEETD
jgi:hypothetical protein